MLIISGNNLLRYRVLMVPAKWERVKETGSFLPILPQEIRKKVMRAVTDTGPVKPHQTPSEPVKNLFTIMNVVSEPETLKYFKDKHASCEIRYGDMKKQLAEDIVKFTEPIREKIIEIHSDNRYLAKVVAEGAEKARVSAAKTVREVREIIGYKSFAKKKKARLLTWLSLKNQVYD